jgi:hypothetical protein
MPTLNQGEPSFVVAWAVKLVMLELLLVIVTGCDEGTVLPGAKEKSSEPGLAVSVPVVPLPVKVTSTEACAPFAAEILTLPLPPAVGAPAPIVTITVIGVVPVV